MSSDNPEPVSLGPVIIRIEEIIVGLRGSAEQEREKLMAATRLRESASGELANTPSPEEEEASRRLLEFRRSILGLEGICKQLEALCLSAEQTRTLYVEVFG